MSESYIVMAKLKWAKSLADEGERRAWLAFYLRFWKTDEGRALLAAVVAGELTPLQCQTKKPRPGLPST